MIITDTKELEYIIRAGESCKTFIQLENWVKWITKEATITDEGKKWDIIYRIETYPDKETEEMKDALKKIFGIVNKYYTQKYENNQKSLCIKKQSKKLARLFA